MQDLTPIMPARFLFEVLTVDTKNLDVLEANHFRKRLRFRTKVSGSVKVKLPHQNVQQTNSSVNCPNPDTLKSTEKPQGTRCGRPKPDKPNLLTLTDVFD
ncbi:hypothetical protein TNCV_1334701 [Trichonephila clavipes]|nr:hypothetical protein TNCV_1334701 [Trichonephila clavipes]